RRHPIPAHRVLAHSDIAPGRKIDPGEKFDWAWLADQGVGHWVAPAPLDADDPGLPLGARGEAADRPRTLLAAYGYTIDPAGAFDADMQTIVKTFQLHFRQARPDGRLDRATLDTLERLSAQASLKDDRIA